MVSSWRRDCLVRLNEKSPIFLDGIDVNLCQSQAGVIVYGFVFTN